MQLDKEILDQILSLDAARFTSKPAGKLAADKMAKVKANARYYLGLQLNFVSKEY